MNFVNEYEQKSKGNDKFQTFKNLVFPHLFSSVKHYFTHMTSTFKEEIELFQLNSDQFKQKENRLNQQLDGYSALILDLESSNDKKDIMLNKANKEKENLKNMLTLTE